MDLYLIHFVFISACVYFSYRSGYKTGQQNLIEVFVDEGLTTDAKLQSWLKTQTK
jgi:hypothetical protein